MSGAAPGSEVGAIVFVARRMPPTVGGIERLSEHTLNCLRSSFNVIDASSRKLGGQGVGYLARAALQVPRLLRRAPGSLIDASDATLSFPLVHTKAPLIMRIHGLDLIYGNRIYQALLRSSLNRVTRFVANSGGTKELILKMGVERSRVTVINPPVVRRELNDLAPNWGPILFVGRLVRRKGIVEFVRHCWPLIGDRSENARLEIVGDGPEMAVLRKSVQEAPHRGRIQLLGKITDAKLETIYSRAKVLVMPNLHLQGDWEGFGMVAAEAAAQGVPVVAFAVDGIEDAVMPGVTGQLVQPGDYANFAATVLSTLRRKSKRGAIASAAIEKWGLDRFCRAYRRVVESVAAER